MRTPLPILGGLSLFVSLVHGQEPVKIDYGEIRDHLTAAPRGMIHSATNLPFGQDSVTLAIIVDTDGNIESAKATAGPPDFFAQAESLEAKRTFKPFLRNGLPVRATFQDYVSIVPLEQWLEPEILFPEIKDWTTLRITLQRTQCYGPCPAYSVEVKGTGEVTFVGNTNVLITRQHHAQLPKPSIEALLAAFRQADYFSLKDNYSMMVTDSPTYKTSIEFDGQKKSVRDHVGLRVGMPEAVTNLEDSVDRIVGTQKWIKGNAETAPSLAAEKWNFKADTDENRALFARAIDQGPADLVRVFIQNGASPLTMTEHGQGALVSAAGKGDLDLVKLLLANQSNPSPTVLSCALGAAARSKNLTLTQFFLDEKSADVNGPPCGPDAPRTVLMNAVQSGDPKIVEEILAAHPDVNAQDVNGNTALASFPQVEKIIRLLISAGANVNARNNQGQTPIFAACMNQNSGVIRALIAAGADLNLQDQYHQTVLHACFGNEYVKAIVDAGADLTLKNAQGLTAAQAARQMGVIDKAELLETALKQRSKQPQ